jgi:hypothetical protein
MYRYEEAQERRRVGVRGFVDAVMDDREQSGLGCIFQSIFRHGERLVAHLDDERAIDISIGQQSVLASSV